MKIRFTIKADRRVNLVDRWWRENRPDSPELFKQELARAQEQLLTNPHSGSPHLRVRGYLFRRVLMPHTRQWLYYRVIEGRQVIVVHTVWGAQRGRNPALP